MHEDDPGLCLERRKKAFVACAAVWMLLIALDLDHATGDFGGAAVLGFAFEGVDDDSASHEADFLLIAKDDCVATAVVQAGIKAYDKRACQPERGDLAFRSGATSEITELRLAGTFVMGLDASLNDGSCDTVVFCDQKKVGFMAGTVIVNALKRKATDGGATEVTGRVVQIQGDENHPCSRARNEGFLAALKAEPGVILVHDASANWSQADAGLQFKEAIRLQKNIDAVYAHNDIMALGVSDAAVELQIRDSLLIVGTDGIDGPGGGLEMLLKNQIDATVHQPLLTDFAWTVIAKMSKDPTFKPKASYEIEPVAFTPRNREELKAKGLTVPSL